MESERVPLGVQYSIFDPGDGCNVILLSWIPASSSEAGRVRRENRHTRGIYFNRMTTCKDLW